MPLADLGDFRKLDETVTTTEASMFSMLLVLLAARVGNIGGQSLNAVFDQFGLESVVILVGVLTVLFQLVRYLYWAVYGGYGKPWSPFIFICVAVIVELLYDAAMKYGVFAVVPNGKNEFLDAARKYYFDADMLVFAGHAVLMMATALIAMILHDVGDLPRYLFLTVVAVGIALSLSGVAAKPPPPPKKAPVKKDEMRAFY